MCVSTILLSGIALYSSASSASPFEKCILTPLETILHRLLLLASGRQLLWLANVRLRLPIGQKLVGVLHQEPH